MSIATMNWALQQRLESPLHQVLLYVIADSAAPDGTTRHCDSEYLVDRSRMSRATVFRKLADLRDWGLVETFTHHGERGQQIYEVRLQLKKFIDMPIKKRKTGDDEGESHSETPAENGQGDETESHSETAPQSHAETGAVAPVRPGQSQSGDCIGPPLSKDSPPNPPPGGVVDEDDDDKAKRAEHLAGFRRDYPRPGRWDWTKVDPVFAVLTLAECERAHAAASHYAREFPRPSMVPKRPEAFLRTRMFENFPDAKLPPKPAPAIESVWYPEDSAEARGLAVAFALAGLRMSEPRYRDGYVDRWIRCAAPLGADLLALADFRPDDVDGFTADHAEGTGPFEAWRAKLSSWTGLFVKPRRIWLEPFTASVHGLPPTSPNFQLRRSFNGLRVPWPWPPRKDGTLTPEERDDGAHGDHDETFDEADSHGDAA